MYKISDLFLTNSHNMAVYYLAQCFDAYEAPFVGKIRECISEPWNIMVKFSLGSYSIQDL